ncbi:hypothetical protein MMC15_001249 [Xylographa vitiligo]|nr:hypothetical protein [Xylographa vitiligo]
MAPDYCRVCFSNVAGGTPQDTDIKIDPRDGVANAIKLNPRNGSLMNLISDMSIGLGGLAAGPSQFAMFTSKFWNAGRTLKVNFVAGSDWQKAKVKEHAVEWSQSANIKFNSNVDATPDILVDFNPTLRSGKPSLSLGWVNDTRSEADTRQVILHEFDHALGAVHEHESPFATISWNNEEVNKDLGGPPNNWNGAKVDANVFTLYTTSEVQATTFDDSSIMLYYYPANWTMDGKGTSFNTQLSDKDKTYIAFCYPPDTHDTGQFNTQQICSWNQPQQTNETKVYLSKKYDHPPALAIGLNSLDIDASRNIRISAIAKNILQDKCTAGLGCWADTILYSAGMTWLELPYFPGFQTGAFSTQDVQTWNQPQLQSSKRINFATAFSSPPKLICFLTELDMGKDSNWRASVYSTDIDKSGFTIHIDSWAVTTFYSGIVTWLAYPAGTPSVASGRFSTSDIRPWDQPRSDNSGTKNWGIQFSKVPKVFKALDQLDY